MFGSKDILNAQKCFALILVFCLGGTSSAFSEVVAAWDFGNTAPSASGWTAFTPGFSNSSTVNGLTLKQDATGGFDDAIRNPVTIQSNAPALLAAGMDEMRDGFDLKTPATQSFTLSGLTEGQGYRLQFVGVVKYIEPAQGRNLTLTIDEGSTLTAYLLDHASLPAGKNGGYSEYMEFVADGSGDVVVTFGEVSAGVKSVSGLVVETYTHVPPDTSLPGYGSHPFSLVETEVDPARGAVTVSWEAALNQRFTLERSTTLTNWTVIATNYPPLGADSNTVTYVDESAASSQSFYRVSRPYDPDKPLNVLMIVVDDLRDHEAFAGNNVVQMPNLDRFAEKGIKFSNAFCQATYCNPSRASFLTGLLPETVGVLNNQDYFRDNANPAIANTVTLPQCFRSNGYYTVSLGKILHGNQQDPLSWNLQHNSYDQPAKPPTSETTNMTHNYSSPLSWCRWGAPDCEDNELSDGAMAEHAVEILREKRTDPFFMAVGFKKPHDPFIAPKKYFDMYPTNELVLHMDPLDATPAPAEAIPTGGGSFKAFAAMDDSDRLEFLRSYAACSTYTDTQIGKVFDAMDELGLWQNTIVMLWTDHGYHQGERGWWNKTLLFDYDAKVPFMAYVPEMVTSDLVCTGVVELIDVYPTLAELAGITPPANLEGDSFASLILNPVQSWNEVAYSIKTSGSAVQGRSICDGRYRYTEWPNGNKELYDHETDPGEWYNLADDPANAALMQSLRQELP